MPQRTSLLSVALAQPIEALDFSPAQWELLLRQARAASLVAHLAWHFDRSRLTAEIADAPRQHLLSAQRVVQQQHGAVLRALAWLREQQPANGHAPLLLGGCAYLAAGLPFAAGRAQQAVEVLLHHAWPAPPGAAAPATQARDDGDGDGHDATPTLAAADRGVPLHQPEYSVPLWLRLTLPELMEPRPGLGSSDAFDGSQPAPAAPGMRVLQPADMLLLAAVRLQRGADPALALRDLVDVDQLARHFGTTIGFWPVLHGRARALHRLGALHFALHWARRLLGTPLPDNDLQRLARHGDGLTQRLADACWRQVFTPQTPGRERWQQRTLRRLWRLRRQAVREPPPAAAQAPATVMRSTSTVPSVLPPSV